MKYYLGLNLSHDSSVVVTDELGNIQVALEEERLVRIKNSYRFPLASITEIFELGYLEGECISVVIGSHRDASQFSKLYWDQIFLPSMHPGWVQNPFHSPPGRFGSNEDISSKAELNFYVEQKILQLLAPFGVRAPIIWVSHEDAHSASAIFGSGWESSLSITLDAAGDDESGVVQMYSRDTGIRDLTRISKKESIGELYSEVTRRYGFKASRHEGKITGLAALGKPNPALEYLLSQVKIVDGSPEIRLRPNDLSPRKRASKRWNDLSQFPHDLKMLVEIASNLTQDYPDLAYAVQKATEILVSEMVRFWVTKTGISNVVLAGGLFANVKVNQCISAIDSVSKVFIFPNMGDGGLAVGGIWRHMSNIGVPVSQNPFRSMQLGPEKVLNYDEISAENHFLDFSNSPKDRDAFVVEKLIDGKIVGVIDGRMEFGPRALGSRSILISPTNSSINKDVNLRLNRTEFMPFAPIVLSKEFSEVFETEMMTDLSPFKYMTMAVNTKPEWVNKIQAAVHVDGTSRPQIVDPVYQELTSSILETWNSKTGIPVLVNTSFNLHEEPIIYSLLDGIKALNRGAVDLVVTKDRIYLPLNKFQLLTNQ